ncbi:MAG: pyridoxal 5'-phosphate synthase glutaminase subunit PdxT [Deltaproteobacteria bacterium]|nr:pyridoxal 5'-phosphate synthase glutaminase subunit PdxT [Deltaproteobacteria bacterium]
MIDRCGAAARDIRLPRQLEEVDGLIMPGGESTTMTKLMIEYGFVDEVRRFCASGRPVFGTCAGAILLADRVRENGRGLLGVIDIAVVRNAYGRQLASREAALTIAALDNGPFRAIFIRAPMIDEAGPPVEILSRYQGAPVLVRQNNILVATFHPELTDDARVHEYFLSMNGRDKGLQQHDSFP